MKLRSLFLTVASVWLISACGARTNEEEFLGYYGGFEPGVGGLGGGGGSGGLWPGGGTNTGGAGDGGSNVGGGLFPTGGRPGIGGHPTGVGGEPPSNTCCEPHGSPGCNVPFVEECTCNLDSYCCDTLWDERCVQVAERACFSACGAGAGGQPGVGGAAPNAGGSTGGSGSEPGNCCTAHPTSGCQNTDIQACVCGGDTLDTFCCNAEWDEICVFEAENNCNANCASPQTGTGGAAAGTGGSSVSCDFSGECGSCLCSNCGDEMVSCQGDLGCLSIAWCIQTTMCSPLDCYDSSTCQGVIDQFGGLNGPSVANAFELGICLVTSGCSACQ